MKKVPILNYVKVLVLAIITVLIVLILANNYTKKNNYERENDDIMNFLFNIKYEELSNYLVEHHDSFIYMAPSSDSSLDNFEKKLKDYIVTNELEKEFVYLDSSGITAEVYDEFKENYFSSSLKSIELNSAPALLVVNEQKVVAVLNSDLTVESVKNFVSTYGVSEW